MKKPILSLFFAGAAVLATYSVYADDTGTTTPPSNNTTGDAPEQDGEHHGHFWREAFEQLDLTDAQKAQIKQIRDDTQPGRERRQQIMAVLTSEQRDKLKQLIEQHRAQHGDGQ